MRTFRTWMSQLTRRIGRISRITRALKQGYRAYQLGLSGVDLIRLASTDKKRSSQQFDSSDKASVPKIGHPDPLEAEPPSPFEAGSLFPEKVQRVTGPRSEGGPSAHPAGMESFLAFLESFLKVQNSPHTKRAYEKDLAEFLSYLEVSGRGMNVHTLVSYRDHLAQVSRERTGMALSHVSINRKIATIKSFLNFLVLNGVLPNNPAKAVKSFRAGRESPTRDIPDDRVQAMLALPARHRVAGRMHHAMMMVLFHLGLRRAELVSLRTADLFEQDGMHVIRVRGKGDKERVLPLPAEVHKSLMTYLEFARKELSVDQPLFSPVKNNVSKIKDKPLHPNAVAYVIKHYARLAGVTYRVSPHSARATAVSNALDNLAPHRAVQHMAGWSSPLMVTRYDKRKEDLRNSAVKYVNYESDADKE